MPKTINLLPVSSFNRPFDFPINGVDAGSTNENQQLVALDLRLLNVCVLQDFSSAIVVDNNGFHKVAFV